MSADLSRATPRPWRLRTENLEDEAMGEIDGEQWWALATVVIKFEKDEAPYQRRMTEEGRANAALIVHCVNLHDELVAALREALPWITPEASCADRVADKIRAVLAKVDAP